MTAPKLSPEVVRAVLAYRDALRDHRNCPGDFYCGDADKALFELEQALLAEPAPKTRKR